MPIADGGLFRESQGGATLAHHKLLPIALAVARHGDPWLFKGMAERLDFFDPQPHFEIRDSGFNAQLDIPSACAEIAFGMGRFDLLDILERADAADFARKSARPPERYWNHIDLFSNLEKQRAEHYLRALAQSAHLTIEQRTEGFQWLRNRCSDYCAKGLAQNWLDAALGSQRPESIQSALDCGARPKAGHAAQCASFGAFELAERLAAAAPARTSAASRKNNTTDPESGEDACKAMANSYIHCLDKIAEGQQAPRDPNSLWRESTWADFEDHADHLARGISMALSGRFDPPDSLVPNAAADKDRLASIARAMFGSRDADRSRLALIKAARPLAPPIAEEAWMAARLAPSQLDDILPRMAPQEAGKALVLTLKSQASAAADIKHPHAISRSPEKHAFVQQRHEYLLDALYRFACMRQQLDEQGKDLLDRALSDRGLLAGIEARAFEEASAKTSARSRPLKV